MYMFDIKVTKLMTSTVICDLNVYNHKESAGDRGEDFLFPFLHSINFKTLVY